MSTATEEFRRRLETNDPELLALAARTFQAKMLALLAPHKIALLAIERQAAEAMSDALAKATDTVDSFRIIKLQLRAIHEVAYRLAQAHAAKEFALLGLEAPKVLIPRVATINKLAKDLRRALASKLLSDDEKMRRALIAAVTAANRSYTDTQLATYRAAVKLDPSLRLQKVWVTNQTAGSPPCVHCKRLHGKILDVDDEFPWNGPAPYEDLLGPPRHPNCRCRLVARLVKTSRKA